MCGFERVCFGLGGGYGGKGRERVFRGLVGKIRDRFDGNGDRFSVVMEVKGLVGSFERPAKILRLSTIVLPFLSTSLSFDSDEEGR